MIIGTETGIGPVLRVLRHFIERQPYCQIKFASGEQALVLVAGMPAPSVELVRLSLGGLVPWQTIWEYNPMKAGGYSDYIHKLKWIFSPTIGRSDDSVHYIRDALLPCQSIDEARTLLLERERRANSATAEVSVDFPKYEPESITNNGDRKLRNHAHPSRPSPEKAKISADPNRCSVLKSTANIDKEAVRWSLSWLPDGRCNSFTRETILLFAPPTSGVYGLFNFDSQLFIGESTNIKKALLRHESETDFQSQHLQPTGFTFEPCEAEIRKRKADELVAKFHPVLQTEAALTETLSLSNSSMVSEVGMGAEKLKTYPDHQELPLYERGKHQNVRRRFSLNRTLGTTFAAIFVASAVVIFYLGMPADYAIQKRANGANPTSDQTEISLRPQNVSSIDTVGGLANQSAEATRAKPNVHGSARNTAVRFATKSTVDRAAIIPMAHSTDSANLSKKWSVQISAAPAKDVADTLVQKLKANGYDGYVVQTEVKGQTYYRVRVGHFDAREKAEAVRQSLARQEGHRDAYLTGD